MNVKQLIDHLNKTIAKLEKVNPNLEVVGYVDQDGGYCEASMLMDLELVTQKARVCKKDETFEVVVSLAFSD